MAFTNEQMLRDAAVRIVIEHLASGIDYSRVYEDDFASSLHDYDMQTIHDYCHEILDELSRTLGDPV